MIYKGKTKELSSIAVLTYTDNITAGNGEKADVIKGKGLICAEFSEILFTHLENEGIKTHFIASVPGAPYKHMVKELDMLTVEVVVRGQAWGSAVERYKVDPGTIFKNNKVEFFVKDDENNDPFIPANKILNHEKISRVADRIYCTLSNYMVQRGFFLADIKLEFGYDAAGNLVLGDELSPDTMRLISNHVAYDKDCYRQGYTLHSVYQRYNTALIRLKEEQKWLI